MTNADYYDEGYILRSMNAKINSAPRKNSKNHKPTLPDKNDGSINDKKIINGIRESATKMTKRM